MSQSVMSKVCDKYNQYLRMEDLKLPVLPISDCAMFRYNKTLQELQ